MTTPTAPTLDIDWTACQGHGLCAELLPDHVELDEWGYPIVAKGPIPRAALKRAKRAAADCPVLALKLGGAAQGRGELRDQPTTTRGFERARFRRS